MMDNRRRPSEMNRTILLNMRKLSRSELELDHSRQTHHNDTDAKSLMINLNKMLVNDSGRPNVRDKRSDVRVQIQPPPPPPSCHAQVDYHHPSTRSSRLKLDTTRLQQSTVSTKSKSRLKSSRSKSRSKSKPRSRKKKLVSMVPIKALAEEQHRSNALSLGLQDQILALEREKQALSVNHDSVVEKLQQHVQSNYASHVELFSQTSAQMMDKYQQLKLERDDLQVRVKAGHSKVENLTKQHHADLEHIQALSRTCASQQDQLESHLAQSKELCEAQKACHEFQWTLDQVVKQNQDLRSHVNDSKLQFEMLTHQLYRAKVDAETQQESYERLLAQSQTLEVEKRQVVEELTRAQAQCHQTQARLQPQTEKLVQLQETLEKLTSEFEAQTQHQERLAGEWHSQERAYVHERRTSQDQIRNLEKELKQARREIESETNIRTTLESKFQQLERKEVEARAQAQAAKAQVEHAQIQTLAWESQEAKAAKDLESLKVRLRDATRARDNALFQSKQDQQQLEDMSHRLLKYRQEHVVGLATTFEQRGLLDFPLPSFTPRSSSY